MSTSKKAQTTTADIHWLIRTDILKGELRPGERLSPGAMGKRFGVSAGVVREALTRLVADRLVSAEKNKGFRVYEISLDDLRHLFELRQLVEVDALRKSIAEGGVSWESEVVAAHYRLTNAPQPGECLNERGADVFMTAHRDFHMALLSACDNPIQTQTCASLWDSGELYRRWGYGRTSAVWEHEHDELLRLALARDIDGAAAALHQHIGGTVEAVTRLMHQA